MSSRDDMVAAALGWIGTPYVHQASLRGGGTDCLGLIRGVWREVLGAEPCDVPAYTPDWNEVHGEEQLWRAAERWLVPVSTGCERPGDVLLFRMRAGAVAKHLGILTKGGECPRFVHAYSGHGVVETTLSVPWRSRLKAVFAFPERIG